MDPLILDLPSPWLGFPKASVLLIDVPARVVTFQLCDAGGNARDEVNTALFEGTFTDEAIAADIYNDLEAHG